MLWMATRDDNVSGSVHSALSSFPVGKRWACVRTYPHEERKAEDAIRSLGFTVFAPKFKKWIRHARKKQEVERYLFPNYLFVQFDPNVDPWGMIRAPDRYGIGVDGVHSLMTNCGIPIFMPMTDVDRMFKAYGEGQEVDVFMTTGLRQGESVEIIDGPLMGFYGRLEGLSDRRRVEVLLDFFGSKRILEFSLSQLKPA